MLENWLNSVTLCSSDYQSWQLGGNIDFFEDSFPHLKDSKIALVGTGREVDTIREYLYALSFPFNKLPIADIGNLRKANEAFLLPVVRELLDNQILPVIISHQETPSFTAQFKAYQNIRKKVNAVIIDDQIPFHKDESNYLSSLQKSEVPLLGNFGLIGFQAHLTPIETIQFYQDKNYDLVRLGIAKKNLEQVEPIIRAADTLYFNLSALKWSEASGSWENTPSGFSSEESCQLGHYAGISDRLSSIGFYGYCADNDKHGQTAQLVAHLIWYLLDGTYNRKGDFPANTDGMIEYIVSFKDYDHNATFWKSIKSGRWWIQVDSKTNGKHELIPCSYEDYQLACQDELSERVLNIFERYM